MAYKEHRLWMSRWRACRTGSGTAGARPRLLHLIMRTFPSGRNLAPLPGRCVAAAVEHHHGYPFSCVFDELMEKKRQLVAHPVGRAISYAQLQADIEGSLANARPRLLRVAHWNGIAPDCIEDVVQETLIEAWQHVDNLREPQRFNAWLDGICRNVCRRQKKMQDTTLSLHTLLSGTNEKTETGGSIDLLDPSTLDLLEEMNQQDLATLLDRAMGHLPTHTSQLLEMSYLAGLTQREVAARLEITIGALELRLHRARRQLRQILNGTLRTEAQWLGLPLDPEDAQNWHETRQWCWLCGKRRLLSRFETRADAHVDLSMRCPDCSNQYDLFIMHSQGLSSLDGLHAFRPAFKRVLQGMSKHFAHWNAIAGKCLFCHGPASIHIFRSDESETPRPPGRYWISNNCPRCGKGVSDIATIITSNQIVQRFILQHERYLIKPYHLIEYNGVQAICIRMVDLTSATQLTTLVDAQTLHCLATFSD
jgi:RNA polymerase sigma factor (sigma-70 family)